MLYILEGCDGVGKSTLANSLKDILDAEIIHCNQYTPNNFYFFNSIAEAAKDRNIIADRFCYGQFIYQEEKDRPLGEHENSALANLHELETKMLAVGVKAIYVTAPVEDIKDRLAARGESLINGLTVEEVQARYRAVKSVSILPWLIWKTGGEE